MPADGDGNVCATLTGIAYEGDDDGWVGYLSIDKRSLGAWGQYLGQEIELDVERAKLLLIRPKQPRK